MKITDELRKFMRVHHVLVGGLTELTDIADRIDAEHEKAMAEHEKAMSRAGQLLADAENDRDYNYANWQECKQKVLQGNITFDELNARIESLEDELSYCIELPKDADGKHIQPSDIPHLTKANDGKRLAFCPSLELRQDGTWRLAGWTPDRYRILKPTVEDMLWELLGNIRPDMEDEEAVPIVEAYAEKLRLADDGEEQQ